MTMDPAMAIEVAATSRQRALEETTIKGDSDIQRFYCNTTMFITGGTGFMGKQMIEKLLRSCQLSKIYILIRSKKGKSIHERLAEMLTDPVFEMVRKMKPSFAAKLIPVEGDVGEIRLGVSDQDWETLADEVNVIFHMAATTRFDDTLRVATLINVRGTREIMFFARACKKLISFVHVSTAYTQAIPSLVNKEVYEEFKPSPIPPETLISMAENVDEARLNSISTGLVGDWPNTYTFAKSVAEELIRTMSNGLPICIVRPGVVVACYREPNPGWMDISCAFGVTGIFIGMGLGVLHTFFIDDSKKFPGVPCDHVNNVIIAAGREARHGVGGDSTKIYTVSSVARNPILNGKIFKVLLENRERLSSPKAVYYMYGMHSSNKCIFILLTWFFHFIPAYIVDFICLLLGKERRLVKLYKKVYKMTNSLCYFGLNNWIFDDKNTENLYKNLSKTDKVIFDFDITALNWPEFIQIWSVGTRKYIVKDGLKGTAEALRKQKWLRCLHYLLSALYFYIIFNMF